jgi:hypothetical protein
MRSSRSSSLAVGVLALVLVVSVVPAAAVSTSAEGVPDAEQVGSEIEATFTLTDLYEDGVNDWTLRASTELENVSWTVSKRKLSGDTVRENYGGESFTTGVTAQDDVDRVTVTVTGTVPAVANWSYDPREQFRVAQLVQVRGENENRLGRWQAHHYTEQSSGARDAIDAARAAVGDDAPQEARSDLQQAVSAYDAGNFENAVSNAEDAEEAAARAQQSREQRQLLLYAGIGVVALLVVFGGIYYYRSRQTDYNQLR